MLDWETYLGEYMNRSVAEARSHIIVKEKIKREIVQNYSTKEYKNILEVGGGSGALATDLTSIGYNVTIMDPKTVGPIPNIEVVNEKFKLLTDISSYDLIISIYGCEAIDVVIRAAILNSKPFLVVPCTSECLYMQNRDNNSIEVKNINELVNNSSDIKKINLSDNEKIIMRK